MNYTFQLKEPKSKESTLIYFVVYFKEENKNLSIQQVKKLNLKNGILILRGLFERSFKI